MSGREYFATAIFFFQRLDASKFTVFFTVYQKRFYHKKIQELKSQILHEPGFYKFCQLSKKYFLVCCPFLLLLFKDYRFSLTCSWFWTISKNIPVTEKKFPQVKNITVTNTQIFLSTSHFFILVQPVARQIRFW